MGTVTTDYNNRSRQESIPPSSVLPGRGRPSSLPSFPVRTPLDEMGADEGDLPVVSVLGTFSRELEEIAELVGESYPHAPYQKENGLYIAGNKPCCTIIGLARTRSSQDLHIQIPFLTIDDLALVAPLVRQQPPYNVFVVDAPYQDTLSSVDIIVQRAAQNRLYYNHQPLISVVDNGREELLPELVQQYAQTPFRFIAARKYGSDVIDAHLFGQLRY